MGKSIYLRKNIKTLLQGGKKKHDILISSAGTSKAASPSAPRRELCDEAGAFTLDRGLAKHPNKDVGRHRLHSDKSGDSAWCYEQCLVSS